jgi:hypothetical protein
MSVITRKRGDTYPIEILVSSDGDPLDVSNCTFKLTVDPSKAPVDDTNNVIVLTGTLPGDTGRVNFPLTDNQADHLGKYYYDIQMTDGAGIIRTLLSDKFVWTQDITKAL